MKAAVRQVRIPRSPASRLTKIALMQTELSGFSEMLRAVGDLTVADGCLLWQETPGSDLRASPPKGELYILADWFRDGLHWSQRSLPLDSIIGQSVLTSTPTNVSNIQDDPRVERHLNDFFRITGMQVFCTFPVDFPDGKRGAINVYRKSATTFDGRALSTMRELAELIPDLYRAILNRVSFNLTSEVNHVLWAAERESGGEVIPGERVLEVIERVAQLLQHAFHSLEVSIFLEDLLTAPGAFEKRATTCQEFLYKDTYTADDQGFTPWILRNGKPLRVFDLAHWEEEKDQVVQRHPGLVWKEQVDIVPTARKLLSLKPDQPLQPISFMGQPVVLGGRVLGVVRVCAATRAPYYYGNLEVELLGLVAAELGQYWSTWLKRRTAVAENQSWRRLVNGISQANRSVVAELTKGPDLVRIFQDSLAASSPAFPGAVAMDVRLYDALDNDLYFAAFHGPAWDRGTATEISARRRRRFPLNGVAERSEGTEVFRTGVLKIINEAAAERDFSPTFPNTHWMIIAPISDGERRIGVLDIRGLDENKYPAQSSAIAELLGLQLGLYHSLAAYQVGLRRTYFNLGHQLKSPLNTAQSSITKALVSLGLASKPARFLEVAQSALKRVRRVSTDIRVFAELEEKGEIPARLAPTPVRTVVEKLREIAADHEARVEPGKHLDFCVQEKPSQGAHRRVLVDLLLLEHAVSNLCDNALKYSYPGTTVMIRVGFASDGRFQAAVQSEGIPARRHETDRWTERGWRSEEAESVDADGTGLGLYIVEHIMRAHHGELEIEPVSDGCVTLVRLIFPSSEERECLE